MLNDFSFVCFPWRISAVRTSLVRTVQRHPHGWPHVSVRHDGMKGSSSISMKSLALMNLGPLNSWAKFRMWPHFVLADFVVVSGLATPTKNHRIFQESGSSSDETNSLDGFTKFGYQTPPNDLLMRSLCSLLSHHSLSHPK